MKHIAVLSTLLALFCWSNIAFGRHFKVLAIGNSFSADAVEEHLWNLCAEAGDTLIIGNAYIGGCSIDRHFNNLNNDSHNYSYRKVVDGILNSTDNLSLKEIVNDENWDIVSLQQSSPLSGRCNSYKNLPALMAEVKEASIVPDFELVWHNTWAYAESFVSDNFKYYGNSQKIMFDSIVAVTKEVIPKCGFKRIIPSGVAIQNARSIFGDILNRDGFHLSLPLGRFVAACVWMEFITGKDVTELNYRPSQLSDEDAAKAKCCAHDAKYFFTNRPEVSQRLFKSNAVEAEIVRVKALLNNPKLAWMFENCFPNTLDTTVKFRIDDNGNPDTFVITGDIPAMWLRDSSAQVWPYLQFMSRDPLLRLMIEGVIRRQFHCILLDPYANAFNFGADGSFWESDMTKMIPQVHERKWEVDSLCYPIRLAYEYWKLTGDVSIFDSDWILVVNKILSAFVDQQRKDGSSDYRFQRKTERAYDTLCNNGLGSPVKPCGLIASAFRPSDDATTFLFHVPSNFFAVTSLRKAAEILESVNRESDLASSCSALADEVESALQKYAIYDHPVFGKIYAYEVDGFGNHLLMDDANVPSLLALPYLGDVDLDDPIYQNTRSFVWSDSNPYFFKSDNFQGIGGPHVGPGMVWPMSIMMKAFTSKDSAEIKQCLDIILASDHETGFIHESFDVNNPALFTRPWFAWQNTLFGELIINLLDDGVLY